MSDTRIMDKNTEYETRYHLAKWNNANEVYTIPTDMCKTTLLCFMSLDAARQKVKALRENGQEWSIVKSMPDASNRFVID